VTETQTSSIGSNDHNRGRTWIQLSGPLLIHVAEHFFLGAGPFLFHELSDSDQNQVENDATKFGASFLMGGWW
jgi:hypothetical protein